MQSDTARTENTSLFGSPFARDDFDGPAHQEMVRQFGTCGSPFYSLDAMWRAAGLPEGRDAKTWLKAADELVAGVSRYFRNLDRLIGPDRSGASNEVLGVVEYTDAADDCWRAGDRMATQIVAEIYARFLDFADNVGPAGPPPAKGPKLMIVD